MSSDKNKLKHFLSLSKNLDSKTYITDKTETARPVKFDEGFAKPMVFEGSELKDVFSKNVADSNVANSAGIETGCFRSNSRIRELGKLEACH